MLMAFLALFGGLVILVVASDWLVDGAVGIAGRLGISTMVIGLTVVAYGTSFPEFVVSLLSAQRGVVDFAIGNIVGSNIANIGLVLGVAAMITPLTVKSGNLFRRDLPLLAAVTSASVYFFMDGEVALWEGLVLLGAALWFTVVSVRHPDPAKEGEDELEVEHSVPKMTGLLLAGIAGLVGGAYMMVDGGTIIAQHLGISNRIIGLTVVAVGTSLPELAASVAGARRGHPELAVGNVLGSCLFNLTFVMGSAATITPLTVDAYVMRWDLAVMVGLTFMMWLLLRTGYRLQRWEGMGLVASYVGFMGYLVVSTAQAM